MHIDRCFNKFQRNQLIARRTSHKPHEEPKMFINCNKRKACYTTVGFFGIAFVIIFLLVPTIWRYSPSIQKSMIFLNHDHMPDIQNYSYPEVYGIDGTRNFYIDTKDHITLGVWHILPSNLIEKYGKNESSYEQLLSHGEPIIIYMHGNSGARANDIRIELYRKLRDINCHVIAVDYRSYADSTVVELDETGIVSDVMETFKWVYKRAKGAPIFGWGHSLGTGIGAHAFSLLEKENIYPSGLILEAPFNKISEAIREYSTTKVLRYCPWFDFFIIDPVIENGIVFDTEQNLKNAKVPVLILHAQDDIIIPYQLSENLYNYITTTRNSELTELVLYDAKYEFGHQFICRDKEIEKKIEKFIQNCLK
ncbi:lysophosphatidylserine lipase ABHD12-like isoform X2 [Rhopalosiphum padi]|uniref:lysophosphatidylserine lipase ABHD12-like isoform X2 n=1 Tax=Rhopalosiphum padi TaxID=40932 RepID=UPI00298D756B|nr:lysophosphatidylserine lipase ABHD12-like isoform X2 [Rhopalosiphum padi]